MKDKPIIWICYKCGWLGKSEELDDPYNCPRCSERTKICLEWYHSNLSGIILTSVT